MQDINCDERAETREQANITIGKKVFHPVRLSNENVRKLRTAVAESQEAQRKLRLEAQRAENAGEAPVFDEKLQDVISNSLNTQLTKLLIDDDDKPPTLAHLTKHLDSTVAGDLFRSLMGDDEEEGNSSTPSTTPTPSTSS